MRGEGGEALDVALGLLRAPALRTVLRARLLPEGVGEVLAIASGSTDRVRSAAERTGHAEAELLEAARFYVQQILLTADADAYRVLGADRGADHAILRDHHRHLLRWLHPDRSPGTEWDSALSTRVNQAWNHLRTESTRAAYDQTLPDVGRDVAADVVRATTAATAAPRPERVAARVAAIAAPTVGGAAALAEPPTWRAHAAPAFVSLLGILCLGLIWLAITREDTFDDLAPVPAPVATTHVAKTPVTTTPLGAAPVEAPPVGAAIAAIPTPPVDPVMPVEMVEQVAAVAAPAVGVVEMVAQPAGTAPPPAGAATAATPAKPAASITRDAPIAAIAAPTNAGARATPAGIAAIAAPSYAAAIAAPTEIAAIAAPTKATAVPAEDPLQLFLEAEDAIRGVTSYLVADTSTQPAWLNLSTSIEAASIRNGLQARHAGRARTRMEVDAPNWTLAPDTASMSAAYRLDARRNTVETGVLRIDLSRSEQQWLVTHLHLEQAR